MLSIWYHYCPVKVDRQLFELIEIQSIRWCFGMKRTWFRNFAVKLKWLLCSKTNAFHLTAPKIANLYKNRWQIELFFKWLKQHLKIKKFWGTTENAVRIQISSAIIAYCLVAIVQYDLQLKRSTNEVLQILSISLMDKTPLIDLFERTDFNNIKELDCPLFPGLFD